MRHVITGSSGFLGSALLAALTDAVGFDLPDYDVRKQSDCNSMPLTGATVWHLAALNGSTQGFYDSPGAVLDVQIRGTMNMLDACIDQGAHTFILFSSSEAYQTPPVVPTPENAPLVIPDVSNPRFSYGGGKIAAELMAQWSGLPRCLTIRPHNVYSGKQRPGHVIPDFIERARSTPVGGTFEINGPSTRSFIYIDDFVSACVAIAKHHENDERCREIYHVGTEEQTTTVALAGQISDLMSKKGPQYPRGYAYKFKTNPGPEGGTRSRCPDTSKLRALGWSAKTTLTEGLKKTIASYLEKESEWPT